MRIGRRELLLGILVVGCAPPAISPAELQTLSTHTFEGRTAGDVTQATVAALKLQGYEVLDDNPRVRTVPKLVSVTGNIDQVGNVQTYGSSVAWDIEITEQPGGASAHADARIAVNGVPVSNAEMSQAWARRNFPALFDEIKRNLPKAETKVSSETEPPPPTPPTP